MLTSCLKQFKGFILKFSINGSLHKIIKSSLHKIIKSTIYTRRVTRNFLGQGVFLQLDHFHKHSPTTRERKAPLGKNLWFFRLETLTNFVLNEKFCQQMTIIRAFFTPNQGNFFQYLKKGRGELPPPHSPFQLRASIPQVEVLTRCW